MALTVSVAAASTDLTTLEQVLKELPSAKNEDHENIQDMIEQASDAILTECNRPFARATYIETVKGYGHPQLLLSRRPIVSVTTIVHNSTPIVDYTIEDPDASILFRPSGWTWTAGVGWNLTNWIVPGSEEPQFTVTYIAGYLLPRDDNRNLPKDIERACIETVKTWFISRDRDPSLAENSTQSTTRRYFEKPTLAGLDNLPPRALALLAPWVQAA